MRGSEPRKGLPFGSPALCTDDARVERSWHYCFGTKDPNLWSLIAGWSVAHPDIARYRYRCRVFSIACGIEDICCANNIQLQVQNRLSHCSKSLATSRDRDMRELPQWRKHSAKSRFKCGAVPPNDITPGIVNIPAQSIVHARSTIPPTANKSFSSINHTHIPISITLKPFISDLKTINSSNKPTNNPTQTPTNQPPKCPPPPTTSPPPPPSASPPQSTAAATPPTTAKQHPTAAPTKPRPTPSTAQPSRLPLKSTASLPSNRPSTTTLRVANF
jgi:hypothetical protein